VGRNGCKSINNKLLRKVRKSRSTEQNPEIQTMRCGRAGVWAAVLAVGAAFPAWAQLDRDLIRPRREEPRPARSTPAPTPPAETREPEAPPVSAPQTAAEPSLWSVVLATFKGESAEQEAAFALGRSRETPELAGAFVERRGTAFVLALGRFSDPGSPEAQAELKRVQGIEFQGGRPFAMAFLSPPVAGSEQGAMPQYNLLRTKEQYGPRARFTLQIGAYGRRDINRPTEADLTEFRRAAERAVWQLRREGELAFYYHGPNMSMVTIGIFDGEDFDPAVPGSKSQRVIEAQKRHPYNLFNGQGVRERRGGQAGDGRMQPSALVIIPEK
jgi:hypothetical protein